MCFYKGSECNTLYFVSRNTSVQHAPTKRGLFIQPVLKSEHSPFCSRWCGGHKKKDASGKIYTYNTNHSKQCVTSLCQWTLTKTSYCHVISMPKGTGEWINNEWVLFGVLHSCSSNRKELCNKRDPRTEEWNNRTHSAMRQETNSTAGVQVLLSSSRAQVWFFQSSDFLVMDRNPQLMAIMVYRKSYPP